MATIFFSWQADTPNRENRTLIGNCIKAAIDQIVADGSVEEAARDLEIDSDTKGAPGTPPIVDTIFKKIDRSAVFIADLTFVAKRLDGRLAPNPNVLIEYGWALKGLQNARIVCVMNTAMGKPTKDDLPFDLAHLRWPITYECAENAPNAEKRRAMDGLTKDLRTAIEAVLQSAEFKQSLPKQPAPVKFQMRAPVGEGRFRHKAEPLGANFDFSLAGGNNKEIRLCDGSAMWLRVAPISDPGRVWSTIELKRLATEGGLQIQPLARWSALSYVRGPDGFGVFPLATAEDKCAEAVAYIFNSGEIWSADYRVIDSTADSRAIPLDPRAFFSSLEAYSDFLSHKLGIPKPHHWIAGFEGIKDRGVFLPTSYGPRGACLQSVISMEGEYKQGESAKAALRPFFRKIHDMCGEDLPKVLEDD